MMKLGKLILFSRQLRLAGCCTLVKPVDYGKQYIFSFYTRAFGRGIRGAGEMFSGWLLFRMKIFTVYHNRLV